MKKIIKTSLISLALIMSLVISFCLGVIINGSCFATLDKNFNDNSKWMKNINDEVLVNEIIMPGSHDAGSYKMVWLGETQQFSIEKQLQMGVRYFDIRVNKVDNNFLNIRNLLKNENRP